MPRAHPLAATALSLALHATAACAPTPSAAGPSHPPGAKGIVYVPGSTERVEQLIGEIDKERHRETLNKTASRYQLFGTDLGYSFEHQGRTVFLFGDAVGIGAGDPIATTSAIDAEHGVKLDFLSTAPGRYLPVQPTGVSMKGFETPVSGISIDGHMYVIVKTGHSPTSFADRSLLTKFKEPDQFSVVREISAGPAGHFITAPMHLEPAPTAGLPEGPYVLLWGTGEYRHSDVYLSAVPVSHFEDGAETRYFTGMDAQDMPTWGSDESSAKPVVVNGSLGDVSVTWCKDLNLWIMTYDQRAPTHGIVFRSAARPWGPWSEPQVIFNGVRDGGFGHFIHQENADDGLEGPVIGEANAHPKAVRGGTYAPYVIERFTRVRGNELLLYYVVSTWNPYVVQLMKSRFTIQ